MPLPERITPTELATIRDRHPNINQPTLEEHMEDPILTITDTELVVNDPSRLDVMRPPGDALPAWSIRHGLIPANISINFPVVRDPEAMTITYTEFIRGDDGRILLNDERNAFQKREVTVQLTEPPEPWPEALYDLTTNGRTT